MFKMLIATVAATSLVLPAAGYPFANPFCEVSITYPDGTSYRDDVFLDNTPKPPYSQVASIVNITGVYPHIAADNFACTAVWLPSGSQVLRFGEPATVPEGSTLATLQCEIIELATSSVTFTFTPESNTEPETIVVPLNNLPIDGIAEHVESITVTATDGVDAQNVHCSSVSEIPFVAGTQQDLGRTVTQLQCTVTDANTKRDVYDNPDIFLGVFFEYEQSALWVVPLDNSSQPFTMGNRGKVKELLIANADEVSPAKVTCVSSWYTDTEEVITATFDASRPVGPPQESLTLTAVRCNSTSTA